MNKISKFEKISYEQFLKDFEINFKTKYLLENEKISFYNNIQLPKRATTGSAGHDFFLPYSIFIPPKSSLKIPTGIRVKINEGWVLKIYPRSSLGFKYRMQIDNTTAIIDSDYFYSKANEGHIWIKISNQGEKDINLTAYNAFVQGIFVPYGITIDDEVTELRTGGIGSTNKE